MGWGEMVCDEFDLGNATFCPTGGRSDHPVSLNKVGDVAPSWIFWFVSPRRDTITGSNTSLESTSTYM